MNYHKSVKPIFYPLATLTLILCGACSVIADEESGLDLPPPKVLVVQLPETGSNSAIISATSEPASEVEAISPSEFANQLEDPAMMIGTESDNLGLEGQADLFVESGLNLVRHNALLWHKVEPNEGDRNWDEVAELERKLLNSSEFGLSTILIVRGTPSWAQQIPGTACGPIRQDKLVKFAAFLTDAVSRYSSHPFNVKFWELGNEPDVDSSLVRPNSAFGCWGNKDDTYYGGEYYGEMLNIAYPAIKAADPEAAVLIGGLLLDCDPTNPPEGKDCKPGKFLEGILRNGGGNNFDIVSFHGYPPFGSSPSGNGGLYYDEQFPSWAHRGGVVLGKIDFLRQVMEQYGVNKPIIHSEGSLICPEHNSTQCNPPGEDFFEIQADYIVRLYVRNWANGINGTIWYKFEGPGWRYGGLLNEDQVPKPAYYALQFLTRKLSGAVYSGQTKSIDQVRIYEFIKEDKRIWVLWSADEKQYMMTLNQAPKIVFDKYGNQLSFSHTNEILVNSPMYLEFSP
jgi:hypothetical protein